MDNQQQSPFVTVFCDIVNNSDADGDSDKTIELSPNAQQSPSPPQLSPIPRSSMQSSPSTDSTWENNNIVSDNFFPPYKTRYFQDSTRSEQIQNEISAIVALHRGDLTINAVHAPRESLRTFLQEQKPLSVSPIGENKLNKRFEYDQTLLHTSVKLLKHDIVDLLLTYGADVNIFEEGKTVAHRAAENNDTLLCRIIRSHRGDFSLLNYNGETPLMVAIALDRKETIQALWHLCPVNIPSATNESILHYAARHNNMEIAAKGCHVRHLIDLDQRSTDELRTALHIAVQQSNIGITRLLLENGAKDDWKDFLGMHARHYVRDNTISVLFLQRQMLEDPPDPRPGSSLNNDYQRNTHESTKRNQATHTASTSTNVFFPSKKGKFSSTTRRKGEDTTPTVNEPPYDQQEQGTSQLTTSHPVLSKILDLPQTEENIATEVNDQLALPGNSKTYVQPTVGLDISAFILYDPRLRDDTRLPKSSSLGFEPEYMWTEEYPIEPSCPLNYTRPDLDNLSPKIVYSMYNIKEHKFHLMHLKMEYCNRLRAANRPSYKRDLYEVYCWERKNIDKTLRSAQGNLFKAALKRSLPRTIRFGPSC